MMKLLNSSLTLDHIRHKGAFYLHDHQCRISTHRKKKYFIFSNLLFKYLKHFQIKGKNQVHGIRTGLKLFYFTLTFFTIKAIFLSRNRVIHRFSSLNQTLEKNGFSRWCLENSLPHKWLDLHIPLHPLLEFDLQL